METDLSVRLRLRLCPYISCAVGSGSPFPASVAISSTRPPPERLQGSSGWFSPLLSGFPCGCASRASPNTSRPWGAGCRSFHGAAGGVRHRGPPTAPRKWCSRTESEVVRLTLAGLPRQNRRAAVQAPALLDDAVEAILATARLPRERGLPGHGEPGAGSPAERGGHSRQKNTHPEERA